MFYVYVNFLYGRLGQDSLEEEISFNLNGTFLKKKKEKESVAVSSKHFIHTLLFVCVCLRGMLGLSRGSLGLGMLLQKCLLSLSGLVRENLHLCFGQC